MTPLNAARVRALRLDDVGASSKRYEVYSKRTLRWGPLKVSGNWLFLKHLPSWKAHGPYRELSAAEWGAVFDILRSSSARMTVAITAAWADRADRVTPFPQKFPAEAEVLKAGAREGLIEIANHGLTHCVLAGNKFRPHWMTSNRQYHREFWDWVPVPIQEQHVAQSQEILQNYFELPIVTFVPPGNVFTERTLEIAARYGLRYVSCDTAARSDGVPRVLGNENVEAFHDRDLVLGGVDWLRALVARHPDTTWCTVGSLAGAISQ